MTFPASSVPDAPVVSVLICTYNRAALLGETLDSLAAMSAPSFSWNVIVVDNNSSDATPETVNSRIASFPAPLIYLRDSRQGKSYALNTGLDNTKATFIAFTDDDVRVDPRWLESAISPMIASDAVAYTGGAVRPIWGGPRPAWLPDDRGDLWGAIATVDYGPERFTFEDRRRIPLGANMAVRRAVIERVGGFHPGLGRTAGSLLGQEQAEFFYRTRGEGFAGVYVPEMAVLHHVPASRLTKRYFRRWWFGKGISRARLDVIHPTTDLGVDMHQVPRIAGVPRFIITDGMRHGAALATSLARRDQIAAAEHEMMLMYSAGYAWERLRTRRPAATLEHRALGA